ncbi:MAG: hypothetical protein ABH896_03255 [Candidatus Jacksonbacteria bacterium]
MLQDNYKGMANTEHTPFNVDERVSDKEIAHEMAWREKMQIREPLIALTNELLSEGFRLDQIKKKLQPKLDEDLAKFNKDWNNNLKAQDTILECMISGRMGQIEKKEIPDKESFLNLITILNQKNFDYQQKPIYDRGSLNSLSEIFTSQKNKYQIILTQKVTKTGKEDFVQFGNFIIEVKPLSEDANE